MGSGLVLILISDEVVTQRIIPSGLSLFPLTDVFMFQSLPVAGLSQYGELTGKTLDTGKYVILRQIKQL